jgi:hypothetical protein
MAKKAKDTNDTNAVRRPRGPGVMPLYPQRKLINRIEAVRLLGCSIDSIKRMEKRRGGCLDVVKLRGPMSNTYYRVDQLNELFGVNIRELEAA